MSSARDRLLLRLYPPAWRERYGEEFLALLEKQPIGPRVVIDIVAAAIGERAVSVFTLRSRRARGFARGVARFALSIAFYAGGLLIASAGALLLKAALSRPAMRYDFALPAFMMSGQMLWMAWYQRRNRTPGPLSAQPPLGPLSSRGLAVVWCLAIATAVIAKWVAWTSAPATPLDLPGWPMWVSRLVDDPSHAYSVVVLMPAIATVYDRWPSLRIGSEPPDVPRRPLGLA
jgi:hypothetical protein